MLDYARLAKGEEADRIAVTVTFLHTHANRENAPAVFPAGAELTKQRLSLSQYRALYADVGAPWLWWLRRMMPDDLLAKHLADIAVSTYVLTFNDEIAGFFELDASYWPDVNLNYFGLLNSMIGRGLGKPLLQAAINEVFPINTLSPIRRMTVNTCTADHPRALPNYIAAGFTEIRRVREIWDIPRRLGFKIPDHLRV